MTEVHPLSESLPEIATAGPSLAAAVASRICHDVVSPLGAIANGVELLLLSAVERTPEIDLIVQSMEAASARIRFFRLAFGAPGGKSVSRTEIAATLQGIERSSRLTFDWTPSGEHPREQIKAVFLLLQCVESALPMGGRIRIRLDEDIWTIEAEGPRLRVHQPAWDALGPDSAPAPETGPLVQFALLPPVLDSLGRSLELSLGPERIMARF